MSQEKVDYLSEDPVISNQRYCLVSFLERKTDIEISNKDYDLTSVDTINDILKDAKMEPIEIKDNMPNVEQLNTALVDLVVNLKEKFIAGVKVRGIYEKIEDTKFKAEELQGIDDSVGIYLGEVGKWLPFNPDADSIEEQQYGNEKLNDLMKGYRENQAKSKYYFEKRKQDLIQKTIEENEIRKLQNKEKLSVEKITEEENQESEESVKKEVVENIFSDDVPINK